jgi:hypothetical protein
MAFQLRLSSTTKTPEQFIVPKQFRTGEGGSTIAALIGAARILMRYKKTRVTVISQAAEDFDFSTATVLYFFNPFEANIPDVVLDKIETDRAGKDLRLAFAMEWTAQRAVFAKHPWLKCYERWIDDVGHTVALYRSVT